MLHDTIDFIHVTYAMHLPHLFLSQTKALLPVYAEMMMLCIKILMQCCSTIYRTIHLISADVIAVVLL